MPDHWIFFSQSLLCIIDLVDLSASFFDSYVTLKIVHVSFDKEKDGQLGVWGKKVKHCLAIQWYASRHCRGGVHWALRNQDCPVDVRTEWQAGNLRKNAPCWGSKFLLPTVTDWLLDLLRPKWQTLVDRSKHPLAVCGHLLSLKGSITWFLSSACSGNGGYILVSEAWSYEWIWAKDDVEGTNVLCCSTYLVGQWCTGPWNGSLRIGLATTGSRERFRGFR